MEGLANQCSVELVGLQQLLCHVAADLLERSCNICVVHGIRIIGSYLCRRVYVYISNNPCICF
jgi:hypothetical protein